MKRFIGLLMGAMFLVGCGGDTTADTTDDLEVTSVVESVEDTEDADEEADVDYTMDEIVIDGYDMSEDTSVINDIYTKYEEAVKNTKAMTNYTVTTKIVANQESDNEEYCINSLDQIEIQLDATNAGEEQLMSVTSYSDSTMPSSIETTVYFKDNTVYINQDSYKLKVEEQGYSTMDPTYTDVIYGISFGEEAIVSAGEADETYVFNLDPALVTFNDTYAVPVDEMESLTLEFEIENDIVTGATFNYVVNTSTATIQDNNAELADDTENTEDTEEPSDVVFKYSVNTMYTNIGSTKIEYPDLSEYMTEEEFTTESTDTETDVATDADTETSVE